MVVCIFADATIMIMKAGANVNATAVGATYTLAFGNAAESCINVESGYDWCQWYTALAATYPHVANILVDAATSKGAIDIINYDMSGFTNIQEANARQNILWANFERCMKILTDQKMKDFLRTGGSYP